MAAHHFTTRTVVHHEWTLTVPAHHTDVAKALTMACGTQDAIANDSSSRGALTDVYLSCRDEVLVISFTTEEG